MNAEIENMMMQDRLSKEEIEVRILKWADQLRTTRDIWGLRLQFLSKSQQPWRVVCILPLMNEV